MQNRPTPIVSVIVPNYNHARYLRQRIESVLRQTFQDFELILLDDYSTDESREILSSYANNPRVRIEFNETNSGSTFKQWNKGARMARGRYIWFAESDDYADERLLEKLVARLDEEPNSVLCYCRSWQVSADGQLKGFQDSYLPDLGTQKWAGDFRANGIEECRRYLIHCNTVLSASSVLFRKDVYWRVGGADETLVLCGDWKMWTSMALTGGDISYEGQALNYYRYHDASVSERTMRNGIWAEEALRVIGFILGQVSFEKEVRKKLQAELFPLWGSAVLNKGFPVRRRLAILRNAIFIDHLALHRLAPPALKLLRMTIARRLRSLRA
jgi:glycosyltransferase involved in cell wall biosynthesis